MRSVVSAAVLSVLLVGCNQAGQSPVAPAEQAPAAENPAPAAAPVNTAPNDGPGQAVAAAELLPTAGNQVSGRLQFYREGGQLRVRGTISGLKPNSEHGFHVHETGDCAAPDASSAGGHFNPDAVAHGAHDAPVHHTGDMPNMRADAQGVATVDGLLAREATLGDGSSHDILGRGLIIHADPDDYVSQPTGNAGARLACGVIGSAQ